MTRPLWASSPETGTSDGGFSLIELIVYVSLFTVVLAIVGGLLITTTTTERSVRSSAEAATRGQLVVRSVQAGVRNASFVTLTDNVDGTQFLLVRTASGGSNLAWACQAWYYSPASDGTIYMKRTEPAAVIAEPTLAQLADWFPIADGISANNEDIFTAVAGRVSISLDVTAGTGPSVSINSSASMRLLSTTIDPCEA